MPNSVLQNDGRQVKPTAIPVPAPDLGWVDVPHDLIELIAAYRFEWRAALAFGDDQEWGERWAKLDELTRLRHEMVVRKQLEMDWPAIEAWSRAMTTPSSVGKYIRVSDLPRATRGMSWHG